MISHAMKCIILGFAIFSTVSTVTFASTLNAFVVKVEDGDSVRLSVTGCVDTVRYRLHGIDAPERGQTYGSVARERLSELIEKRKVRIVDHGAEKYNRRLCTIYLENGLDVNLQMVREGMAWHSAHFLTNSVYSSAHSEAKEHGRGLWVEDNPIPPRIYRKGALSKRK